MKNLLTFNGAEKLMRNKLLGRQLPSNWKDQFDVLIKDKEILMKKANDLTFGDSIDVNMINQEIKTIKLMTSYFEKGEMEFPYEMPAAGVLRDGFVCVPIGKNTYAYNLYGIRGITNITTLPEQKPFIMIEDFEVKLTDKPITKFAYDLPDEKLVKDWSKYKYNSPATGDLWTEVENYFKTFIDLQDKCMYKVMTLFTFQTYLQDLLDTVFYLTILGGWGSGKTSILESIAWVACRGHMGSSSFSFLARTIDRQRITMFIDELDSMNANSGEEDSEMLSIIRQGYRKGQTYDRINMATMDPESFNVFGGKAFTIHSQSEPALLQRSIPITTVESTDSTLPLVNMAKSKIAKKLRDKLYMWYLDNILFIVDSVRYVSIYDINNNNSSSNRESILASLSLFIKDTHATETRKGRSAELSYIMAILSKLLSVPLEEKWYTDVFKIKKEVEEEHQNIGDIAIIRDILAEKYRELAPQPEDNGWRTPEKFVKVSRKEIYDICNRKLKNDRMGGVSPKDFAGHLRELGFDGREAKRRLRVREPEEMMGADGYKPKLALIFIPTVLRKLGVQEIEALNTTQEEGI